MIPLVEHQFFALKVARGRMDALWAGGWRHFGPMFYRYSACETALGRQVVMPLRVRLARFVASKSQRRVLRRNADLEVRVQDVVLDHERRELFDAHRARFRENVPDALENFLGPAPGLFPCETVEVAAFHAGRLVAASYLDVGRRGASSIYAMFDPAEARRSLGIATMLWEMRFARGRGCSFYYPGYAFHEPSMFDYKKQFAAMEWFDWVGRWHPLKDKGSGAGPRGASPGRE